MALLEKLQPGNIYLVKVSASNEMGDGPFSSAVELAVQTDGSSPGVPRRSHGSGHATGQFSSSRTAPEVMGIHAAVQTVNMLPHKFQSNQL